MSWQLVLAGLSLGSISSFHCIGMCGPLALAFTPGDMTARKRFIGSAFYHSGRILTYMLLGAIFGLLGRQLYLAGFQRGFSIFLGSLMVFYFILRLLKTSGTRSIVPGRFSLVVRNWMGYFLKQQQLHSRFFLGMANGLLPCGMVYLAIAGAVSTSEISESILFMASFGTGTLPAMIILSYFGSFAGISFRNTLKKLSPYVILLMGILLILRGMNLGIPLVSPVLETGRESAVICH